MNPDFPYVELPGTFRGFLRKASLWEGGDHVLSVKGTRFHEDYRRFYYRDIQALIIEKRAQSGSLGWWLVLVTLFVLALLGGIANSPPYSWVAATVIFALIMLRLELTFRRSCRCSIQTAVSREPLPSLIRLSSATAATTRLRGRIDAVQGDLPADIPPFEEEVLAAIRGADPAAPPASAMLEEADRNWRRSAATLGTNFAIAALFLVLTNSVFSFWLSSPRVIRPTSSWYGYAFISAELIAIFLALRYIDGIRALTSLRNLLIGGMILCLLRFTASLTIASIYAFFYRTQGASPPIVTRYYANASGALQLLFAAAGLVLIFAKWDTYRRGESSSV